MLSKYQKLDIGGNPKRIYRLIKTGRLSEAEFVLKTRFFQDPAEFGDLCFAIRAWILTAARNQRLCDHEPTARKQWLPAFERVVEDATGYPLETFTG